MIELPKEACWNSDDVAAVISNEALEGHEGIFLATHTPIRDFEVTGSHAGEIDGRDEQAVLLALSDPSRSHAFCVVQGEPGSGKSHLIRWLFVNWLQSNDIKLLLQRADGSLEGALRQLRGRLPSEFQDLFDKLGRRHRATEQGRANIFLANLANALDPGHFDPPLEDDNWCRANRPAELVGHLSVKREWKGPSRILRLMEGGGSSEAEERNSQSASFDLFDIADLARCCVGVRGTGVLPATEKLAQKLFAEAHTIEEYRASDWTAEEIERERSGELRTSMQLMQALNLRRNDAVQNLLGVSAEGLKTLFRQVRQALAVRGQRLVLLLEDITSWEGIDDSLIDVLVTNAGTRDDMCPLISVVGVTPAYYQKLHGNYRGRITHELSLGEARDEGELQDVATMRSRSSRLSFAARYLAAVRAGGAPLDVWRERRREEASLPPPNRCDDCSVREGCHQTFGEVEGIGLFPFTADSLDRFFAALNDRDSGMTWKTPRGVLQAILSPNLSQARALTEGEFPTALLENRALVAESRNLSPRLSRTMEAKLPDEGHIRDRMRRVLAYWGDRERADTVVLDSGDLAFAGVSKGVFSAFHLPWIGGDSADVPAAAPQAIPLETSSPSGHQSVGLICSPESPATASPAPVSRPKARVPDPPSKRRTPTRSELERLRAQLRTWIDTGELESPSDWNKAIYELVRAVDSRRIGLDPYTFGRVFTPEQIKIEGTGPAQRAYFTIRREEWVREGLEAYLALRLDTNMSLNDSEFHRRALAVMMRRIEGLASDYADRRLSRMPEGSRWSPVPAVVQVLLTRAWLRGAALADDPPHEQLRCILSDEMGAESDPAARCAPWREYLDRTKGWHERLRIGLREMLGTPQGESRGFGLADVSLAVGAIHRLRTTLRFDPVPDETVETGIGEIDKVRDIIASLNGSIARIVRIERDQIRQRADALQANLCGRSIRAHLLRVDEAVETVSGHLANAAPDQVKKWKVEYHRIKPRLEGDADRRTEELLMSLAEEGEGVPAEQAAIVGWLSRVPARDLEEFRDLSQLGEQVVNELLHHVRDCVTEGANSVSLDAIHEIGRALRATVRSIE